MLTDESAQLQTAIDALEAQRSVLGDVVVEAALGPMREKLAALEARSQPAQQRKLATVLFADVSGFTALSETMDAEYVASLMNDLWALVDRVITDHGGRIDKHIGDAVMALWGMNAAREDDPEQAVRAALGMRAAVDVFCENQGVSLAMRIGVNTGPVLLGAMGTTGEYTAMGDAVNLASRLEHAAPTGGVLISHDTYRHVRGVFDVLPQEPRVVKGKSEPVQTYIIQRAKPRAFRMATRGVEGVETRMIGREAELLALQSAYADAIESSETRVTLIVGEAGVGKSRLLYEFDNWLELRPEEVYYFKGRGTPNMQGVTHGLFRDLFAFRFNILESDSTVVALDKFRRGMSGVLEPEQADVVGHWLGFDFSASEAVLRLLDSGDFGATARAHLVRYLRTLATAEPVVVLLEDIHWADDQSLELATYLARTIPQAQLLFVAVARPAFFERRPLWGEGEAAFQRIDLRPLSKRASRALVNEVLQRVEDIPDSLRELVIDSAEGNPFYVEEVIKMMIDQGVIERGERGSRGAEEKDSSPDAAWRVREDRLKSVKVPPTLTGLLQARIDGLSRPERESLQRASVVGRLFWDDAVADLMEVELETVKPALEGMRGRELIFRREHSTFTGTGEYIFKHALLRDVAYETVLLKRRAVYHARAARWLEAHAGDRLGEYLTVIAEHYVQADEGLKAAELLERSAAEAHRVGDSHAMRSALERALALRQAAGQTEGPEVTAAWLLLSRAFHFQGDLPAAEAALQRTLTGARREGDLDREATAMGDLALITRERGEYEQARAQIEEALRLALAANSQSLARVMMQAATLAWTVGDLDLAAQKAEEAREHAQRLGDERTLAEALLRLGTVAGMRGDLDLAVEYHHSSLDVARRLGSMGHEATILGNLGWIAYKQGDYVRARSYAQLSLEHEHDLGRHGVAIVPTFNLAQAELALGNVAAARRGVRKALAAARSLGLMPFVLYGLALIGQVSIVEGQVERALALYGLALAHPGLEKQGQLEINRSLAQLDLPPERVEAALAAGAALDLDAVVQEILEEDLPSP